MRRPIILEGGNVTGRVRAHRTGAKRESSGRPERAREVSPPPQPHGALRHRNLTVPSSGHYLVPLGQTGTNAGKIKMSALANDGSNNMDAWVTAWFR